MRAGYAVWALSTPSFISKLDVQPGPAIVEVDRFKPPPRLRRLKLWWLSAASARAGRADGKAGTPAADDAALPSSVRRLVEEANAFTGGQITHRFVVERNRVHDLKNHIEAAANERKQAIAELDGVQDAAPIAAPAETAPQQQQFARATPKRMAKAPARDVSGVRAQGSFTYLLWLALIFVGEAVVNKKAFELFSETDRTLWLMVTGVAVAVIVCAHLLGKFWKRFTEDGRDRAALVFLAVIALAATSMLGSMRYLAVDQERQDEITLLKNQEQSALSVRAKNVQRAEQLSEKKKLTASEAEELRLAKSRIAGAEAQLDASRGQLAEKEMLQGVERPAIALPLFILLNLVLMGVATALSYQHADPAAEREKGLRKRERRDRLRGLLDAAVGRWSERRDADRLRKEAARSEERAAQARHATQITETARRERVAMLQREVEHLRASYKTAEHTLEEMRKAYCAACDGVEFAYRAVAERYWSNQNRQAQRPVKQLKEAWEKGRRRALKKGMQLPEKPDGLDWRQPAAQRTPLGFVRPPELGCSDDQQPA